MKTFWKPVKRKGLNPWADSDRDGVINMYDCMPKNPKKQEVYNWRDIKHQVISKKHLFHKTELENAKKILKTGELRPSMGSEHFHMSEDYNPHVVYKEFKKPVVLVLEKKNIPYLKKVDYKKPHKYKDLKFKSEREWTTPGAQIKKVLKGIIVNEKSLFVKLRDTEIGINRTVFKSIPTRYVTEEDMNKIVFKGGK